MFPSQAVSRPNSLPLPALPFPKPGTQAKVIFEDREKALQQA